MTALPYSAEELEQVRERAEKATPGPFEVETPMGDESPWIVAAARQPYELRTIATTHTSEPDDGDDPPISAAQAMRNAQFFAHAREDIPRLLATLAERDLQLYQQKQATLDREFTVSSLRAQLAQAHNAALEEAARVCDAVASNSTKSTRERITAGDLAQAIRALMTKE